MNVYWDLKNLLNFPSPCHCVAKNKKRLEIVLFLQMLEHSNIFIVQSELTVDIRESRTEKVKVVPHANG